MILGASGRESLECLVNDGRLETRRLPNRAGYAHESHSR
jgi:hypothetical protein